MKFLWSFLCLSMTIGMALSTPVPANGFVFPDDVRQQRKLEPITPPVLPVLEHLERDPSTLLPGEGGSKRLPGQVKPRFGFGGGFNVSPTGTGGLTASISSSASGAGISHAASQSFSFGFQEGFSASHSASQASSFNGIGSFGGSQASSQAASFGGAGASVAAAASSAAAQGSNFGSQSTSSAFGFNSLNGGFSRPEATFGDGLLDIRHRGVPNFPFPNLFGRNKGSGAAAFRSFKVPSSRNGDDFLAVFGGSQASSQAASAAEVSNFGSQSISSAFGFNSLNGGFSLPEATFGDGLLDIRHRGVPNFVFPNLFGRNKGSSAAAFRSFKVPSSRNGDDFLAVLVSN